MKKVLSIFTALAMAVSAGMMFNAQNAEAVPAFARQMKMACKSCHFQHFPKLNAFGRAFKVNGYTDVAVETIDGDWGTSLPVNLNMSWITKLRYQKTVPAKSPAAGSRSTDTDRGSLQFVDEGTFFIGGRIAEHIGAAVEVADGVPWGNGTIVFGHDLESIGTHLGLALWSADNGGPFWGKDIFNTGLIRGSRSMENRTETRAADLISRTGDYQTWSGVTAYANHEWFFAALGAGAQGQHGVDSGADMSGIYRVGITPPQILGFDTMIGVYGLFGGNSDFQGGAFNDRSTNLHGMDFQAQGNVTEGISLELLANFLYESGKPGNRNAFTRGGEDAQRFNIEFDLGFLNDRLITKFNYLYANARGNDAVPTDYEWQRKSADVVSLGLYWNIRENVSLRPEISWVVGSDSCPGRTTTTTSGLPPTTTTTTTGRAADCGMARNGLSKDTTATVMLWYAF